MIVGIINKCLKREREERERETERERERRDYKISRERLENMEENDTGVAEGGWGLPKDTELRKMRKKVGMNFIDILL